MKKYLYIIVLSLFFSNSSFANCNFDGWIKDLNSAGCQLMFGNRGGTGLSCTLLFNKEDANKRYKVNIKLLNKGKRKIFGKWEGRKDWYVAYLEGVSNDFTKNLLIKYEIFDRFKKHSFDRTFICK